MAENVTELKAKQSCLESALLRIEQQIATTQSGKRTSMGTAYAMAYGSLSEAVRLHVDGFCSCSVRR